MTTKSHQIHPQPKHVEQHNELRPSTKIESVQPAHKDYVNPHKHCTPCALDKYVPRPEFCRRFDISPRTAELMAHRGTGPRVTHLGKRAFYHVDDIAAWCEAQRAKSEARYASQGEA